MAGWTKLFSSLVTSSLWVGDDATLRVFVAMLATSDADGIVEGSVPGFANLARVTVEQMRTAEKILSSPDPDSRTPDFEGRRIEKIEGGWRILNYVAYRSRGQDKDGSKAPAMRRYRARKRLETGNALPEEVTGEPEARGERQEERSLTHTHTQPRARNEENQKGHTAHVFCSKTIPCVPNFLHDEFIRALGPATETTAARLDRFYHLVEGQGVDVDKRNTTPVKFWRKVFESYAVPELDEESAEKGEAA